MARQSTQLSLSKPALYQQEKQSRGMIFHEMKPEQLQEIRSRVGLSAWESLE
jgi:hypothetical protein